MEPDTETETQVERVGRRARIRRIQGYLAMDAAPHPVGMEQHSTVRGGRSVIGVTLETGGKWMRTGHAGAAQLARCVLQMG